VVVVVVVVVSEVGAAWRLRTKARYNVFRRLNTIAQTHGDGPSRGGVASFVSVG
jgi:hypothetical protein